MCYFDSFRVASLELCCQTAVFFAMIPRVTPMELRASIYNMVMSEKCF